MVINWTLQLLSHNLVFLFHLISLGKLTSIPLLNMHLKSSVSSPEPAGFSHLLIFSPSIYIQVPNPSFLEYCSHVWGGARKSTLCLLDKVQSKAIRLINNANLTKSLQPLPHRLLVGDQGYYSSSSEACQDHQKLNSFTPFPSFTAYFTNSISPVIIHPENMQFMERLAFFLLS